MEKEDQLIKELIREGFLKSAPDDFTDNIMQAVANTAEAKKDSSIIIYVLVMVGSILASAGIMAYYKPSIFQNTLAFFGSFLTSGGGGSSFGLLWRRLLRTTSSCLLLRSIPFLVFPATSCSC